VRLLDVAADAGVARFVQLSSVAAVTGRMAPGTTVSDDSPPNPQSPYGRSKLEADHRLQKLGGERGVSVVILRPPSVFGSRVRAYFRMLLRCARLGLPLPIGDVANRRSFMFLDNLADAIVTAALSSREGAYIVTDSAPISTAELYRALLRHCRRPVIVPRVPARIVGALARAILGHRADSLLGDAAYDGSRFSRDFDWSPPVDFETAIARTVAAA
jgi:UDP-glucose 4-epimerase